MSFPFTSPRRSAFLAALLLLALAPLSLHAEKITPKDERLQYSGRWDTKAANPTANWSASAIRFRFNGTTASAVLTTGGDDYLAICIDGKFVNKVKLSKSKDPIVIAEKLAPGEHDIDLVKATEAYAGTIAFAGLDLPDGKLLKPAPITRRIEYIGDSITCGYGNEDDNRNHHFANATENAALTYGVFTSRKLKADWTCIAVSGIWISTPAKGDPMPKVYSRTSLGSASPWDFTRNVPDAVVIDLGTNDSGGKPFDADKYQKSWAPFIADIRKNYPKAAIFCTLAPMGQSKQMEDLIKAAVADINKAGDAKVYAIKLPQQDEKLDGIGADWHPTVKCHQRVADVLAPIIAEKLGWKE